MLLARLGSADAEASDANELERILPGVASHASFRTECGVVLLGAGFHGSLQRGDDFVAAWTRGSGALAKGRRPLLRELRAGALIVASRTGLEISRGPYGGQSLYYWAPEPAAQTLVVSSTLASLVTALGHRPALDADRLAALAIGAIGPDPRATIYRGVRRVLPCETIAFSRDGQRSSFNVPHVPRRLPGDPRGHALAMRDAISGVIARDLASFDAVAVATGGGLDSSALFALVARRAAEIGSLRYTGLTMDFEGPGDDRPHLAALLRKLDAETIRVGADEVGSISDDTFIQDAAPYIWPTAAVDLVARRRAKAWGAQATVSGGGGDQILDGDDASFARRVASGSLLAVLEAARLQVPYNSSPRKRLARFVINPILRPYVPQSWLRRRRAQALGAAAYSHWAGPRLRQQLTSTLAIPPQLSEDWLTAYALSHEMMDAADVRRQAESACGLPQIDPYLDPEFIELVASFPPEELFSGGRTRGLFRDAMRGLLPESLRLRRDKAEFSPLVDATFAQFGGAGAFRDLLTMEASADLGIVDPVVFRGWFDRITKGEQVCYGWFNVWPALGVEAFLRSARGSRDAAELGDA